MQRIPDRQTFREVAEPIRVQLADTRVAALPKMFSTGSYGWYHSGKMQVDVSGEVITVQVSLNITVIGSKDAPSLPGMSSSERAAEQAAREAATAKGLFSPLYPVSDSDEKVRIDVKASSVAQDAFGGQKGSASVEVTPKQPESTPEASPKRRKKVKGGES